MSRQIAIAMWLVGVALLLISLALMIQNAQADPGPIFQLFVLFVILSIGAVIALRRPANPIGWIFLIIVLLPSGVAREYGRFALVTSPGVLPGAVWVAMWSAVAGRVFSFLPVLAILLFPTGRLPSKRWRPILLLPVASAFGFALRVFSPTVLHNFGIANPLGVPGFGDAVEQGGPGGLPLILFVGFTAAALLQRLRRAHGVERQQLKWLIAGASSFLASQPHPGWGRPALLSLALRRDAHARLARAAPARPGRPRRAPRRAPRRRPRHDAARARGPVAAEREVTSVGERR